MARKKKEAQEETPEQHVIQPEPPVRHGYNNDDLLVGQPVSTEDYIRVKNSRK